jgi:hypothetical protein
LFPGSEHRDYVNSSISGAISLLPPLCVFMMAVYVQPSEASDQGVDSCREQRVVLRLALATAVGPGAASLY